MASLVGPTCAPLDCAFLLSLPTAVLSHRNGHLENMLADSGSADVGDDDDDNDDDHIDHTK